MLRMYGDLWVGDKKKERRNRERERGKTRKRGHPSVHTAAPRDGKATDGRYEEKARLAKAISIGRKDEAVQESLLIEKRRVSREEVRSNL